MERPGLLVQDIFYFNGGGLTQGKPNILKGELFTASYTLINF